mmetsp:Transcript_11662/g.48499  ORF Transcript_11662/g.48499 Transcript_11662/m.48499 type:complete len:201 (-) Transcript_11662:748-1350(-)
MFEDIIRSSGENENATKQLEPFQPHVSWVRDLDEVDDLTHNDLIFRVAPLAIQEAEEEMARRSLGPAHNDGSSPGAGHMNPWFRAASIWPFRSSSGERVRLGSASFESLARANLHVLHRCKETTWRSILLVLTSKHRRKHRRKHLGGRGDSFGPRPAVDLPQILQVVLQRKADCPSHPRTVVVGLGDLLQRRCELTWMAL